MFGGFSNSLYICSIFINVVVMRTEIHIEPKTKIEFVNELQARVVLPSGEAYIVSFPSTFNYSSGGHFIKTAEAAFDFKMVYLILKILFYI